MTAKFKPSPAQLFGQAICFALFAAFIGYFTDSPTYQHQLPGMATIKVSLVHTGKPVGECRDRTPEELNRLPENMRAPQICPRERSPLMLELSVNGEPVIAETLQPKGLHGDGRAAFYRRLSIPAGKVEVRVRMKDDINTATFPYRASYQTELAEHEILVVDFDSERERFVFL